MTAVSWNRRPGAAGVIDLTDGTLARGVPAGRTLHLVDLENLAGGPWAGADALSEAVAAYRAVVRPAAGDHVVVATNPRIAHDARRAWPGARILVGWGPDGADRALLAAADPAWVRTHYGRVAIGSGDHAFAPLARRLRSLRLVVVVVATPSHLSGDLRRAASLVLPLPSLPSRLPSDEAGRAFAGHSPSEVIAGSVGGR